MGETSYLTVSKMAKMLGITAYTLRQYEKEGKLLPHHKDEYTGYRYYTREQYEEFISRKR